MSGRYVGMESSRGKNPSIRLNSGKTFRRGDFITFFFVTGIILSFLFSSSQGVQAQAYETSLTIFDQESDAESHPLSNDTIILSGEQTHFYANYSTVDGSELGLVIWNISTGWEVYSVEADDINDDGFTEVVVGRRGGDVHIYDPAGDLLYNNTDVGGSNPYDLEIVDLNNDGLKEIVYGDSEGNLVILNSTLDIVNKTEAGSDYQAVRTIEVGDVNNDSYREVIIGTSRGTDELRVYDASSLHLTLLWAFNFSDGINSNGIALADVNNDGVLDIIAGCDDDSGTVKVFNGSDNAVIWQASIGSQVYSVEADDITGNGFTEVVVGGSGDVFVYNSTGDLLHSNEYVGSGFVYDIELIDLDNNGEKEIVYGDAGSNLVILNSTLDIVNKTEAGSVYQAVRTIEVGDVNNDSYNEVIIGVTSFMSSNKLMVYNASTLNLTPLWDYEIGDLVHKHAIDLADINNDGILDVILGSEDYTVRVFQDVACKISFNSSHYVDMNYDNILKLWKHNQSFPDSGTYMYNISCHKGEYAPQIQQSNVTVQLDPLSPNVTLNAPIDDYSTSSSSIEFNWTATDTVDSSLFCNLTINPMFSTDWINYVFL